MIYVPEDLRPLFWRERDVADFLNIEGEVFKEFPTRRTVKFERGGSEFFVKCHWGVGWREIVKNLLSLRAPVISAKNEWRAIQALEAIEIGTMKLAAYGEEGINPAAKRSFIVTEALPDTVDLESWLSSLRDDGNARAQAKLKWEVIRKVATTARRLHENGINHRDFYLCHLRKRTSLPGSEPENAHMYVMDLHRAQLRKKTPLRWIVKDIGSLYFSSMNMGLTKRDLYRFIEEYRQKPLRETLKGEYSFWKKVATRAERLATKHAELIRAHRHN